jgi:hypothetical protein
LEVGAVSVCLVTAGWSVFCFLVFGSGATVVLSSLGG